ncbi:MAG: ribose-5-phosphate isomerase RpiA [Candidatus Eremiobacteraeota bacterium]|nr:ribose-5-phosphate isomerase RpiA [Candidatus Eremiobacteraeota bacterium]
MNADNEERGKRAVGYRAVDDFVRPGTCIGLGTGSTAHYAIERAGELVRGGASLRAVATSLQTERLCRERGIVLVALGDEPIDVAIDGADEVAADWSIIKGGGGALFREKAVALAARAFVVVVTERKVVPSLGAFPLPVEVVPFSARYVAREIESLGAEVTPRLSGHELYASDNGNVILDCAFGTIDDPTSLDEILCGFHGVITSGLFNGLATTVLVAKSDGTVETLKRPPGPQRA